MLTINYPAFGPEVNVLTALGALDVTNRSIKTMAGVLLRAPPPLFLLPFSTC
jgi:hypothetical protein